MKSEDNTIFSIIVNDFNALTGSLSHDITLIANQKQLSDNQSWRRLLVKSQVSVIETQISFLKKHTKITGQIEYLTLTEKQEQLLSDSKKFKLLENIVHSIESFSNTNYSFITVNKKSKEYSALSTLIKIRNRITHPKQFADINISDKEIKACEFAFNSFQVLLQSVLFKSADSLLKQAEGLEKFLIDKKNSS